MMSLYYREAKCLGCEKSHKQELNTWSLAMGLHVRLTYRAFLATYIALVIGYNLFAVKPFAQNV